MHEQVGRWRYTCYYGFPERGKCVDSWQMLRQLAEASLLPWCIIGDFNDLMSYAEKRDGRRNPHALIDGFSDIVMECGLHDLGFICDRFTWERSRGTNRWV